MASQSHAIRLHDLIGPDRVHRSVYTAPKIFDLEMQRIFGTAWLYVAHASQVPEPGDFTTTSMAGQPIIVIRQDDTSIRVLHNRCPHRGARLLTEASGSRRTLQCPYHGWSFKKDGVLQGIPCQEQYQGSPNDEFDMASVRSTDYRGFVFATLSPDAPALEECLGAASRVLDNMVERAPDGELEIVPGRFRLLKRNNWKIYLENLHDGMHPRFVHQSSIAASLHCADREAGSADSQTPLSVKIVNGNNQSTEQMRLLEVNCHALGHSDMRGFRDPAGDDAVFRDYHAALAARIGSQRADEVLRVNFHNASIYPNFSLHPSFLQLRVLFPLGPAKTLLEVWTFRMKGASDEINQRNIVYANTVHSPSSIIKADDLEIYARVQSGLASSGREWISQQSGYFAGQPDNTGSALSEHYIRNQYRAWLQYMT